MRGQANIKTGNPCICMYQYCVGSLFHVAISQIIFQKFLKTEMNATIQYSAQCRGKKV